MNIALCLSGQPRNYIEGYNYIQPKLLRHNNIDVFSHCIWDNSDIDTTYIMTPHSGFSKQYIVEHDTNAKIENLYNFKKIEYSKNEMYIRPDDCKMSFPQTDVNRRYSAMISKFYSIEKVLSLVKTYELENNIEYDWLILTRYDLFLQYHIKNLDYLSSGIYVGDSLTPRNKLFDDNIFLLSKEYRFIFDDIAQQFKLNYDKMINLKTCEKSTIMQSLNFEWQNRAMDIINAQDTHGEIAIGYHLIFKNALQHVKEIEMLKHKVTR